MTDGEILKIVATVDNTANAYETLRQVVGNNSKMFSQIRTKILKDVQTGQSLTGDAKYIESVIDNSVSEVQKALNTLSEAISGIDRPGIIPYQSSLMFPPTVGLPEGENTPYNTSGRPLIHRSGLIQPPIAQA